MESLPESFSDDYACAKARFLELSIEAGGSLHEIGLNVRPPENEQLSIDIAWFGSSRPRRALIHSSGIHGVEGFTGSAIQLELLQQLPVIGEKDALILVHVLNPYGMASTRRVNEANVDLNRNFIYLDKSAAPSGKLFPKIDSLFNPQTPSGLMMFNLRAALIVGRYGMRPLKETIGQGQHENPAGLFYTGEKLQPGPARYVDWLREHLSDTRYIFAIDVHTGLGAWAQESLFFEKSVNKKAWLGDALGRSLIKNLKNSVGYETRGGLATAFRTLPHKPKVDYVTQEFGTYSPIRVLRALQRENYYRLQEGVDIDHPSKQQLKETFYPVSEHWRRTVLEKGVSLAQKAAQFVFD